MALQKKEAKITSKLYSDLQQLDTILGNLPSYSSERLQKEIDSLWDDEKKIIKIEKKEAKEERTAEVKQYKSTEDMKRLIERMKASRKLFPKEMLSVVHDSFQLFFQAIKLHMEYHGGIEQRLTTLRSHINRRRRVLSDLYNFLSREAFLRTSPHEGFSDLIAQIKHVISVLVNERYAELLDHLEILDSLFSEFNTSFTMIMSRINELKKKKKTLSDHDLIPVRTVLDKNVKIRLPSIRGRQKAIDEKLVEILMTEAVLSRKIKALAKYEKEEGKGFNHLTA